MKTESDLEKRGDLETIQENTELMIQKRIAILNQMKSVDWVSPPLQFEKRTYTVDEIQDILSISRTSAYNLVKKKVFHSVRIGGCIRISKKSFDTWLDNQL